MDQGTRATPPEHRCDYQDQDTALTLREGLAEYYRKNPGVTPPAQASEAGAKFFASHDVTHVVFGTTTQILDISAWDYLEQGLAAPEVQDVIKDLRSWDALEGFLYRPPQALCTLPCTAASRPVGRWRSLDGLVNLCAMACVAPW